MTPPMLQEAVELQVRLLLQRKCAGLARSIAGVPCPCVLRLGLVPLVDIGFTLLVYDRDGEGHVAHATSLELVPLVDTFRWLLERWDRGDPPEELKPEDLRGRYLIEQGAMDMLGAALGGQLPEEQGFALLVGQKRLCRYISNGNRDDIIAMFREALMPEWEALAKL